MVKYRGAPEKGEKGAPLCVREAASSTQNLAIVISVRIQRECVNVDTDIAA